MAENVQVTLSIGGTAAQDMQRLAKAAEEAAKYEQMYAQYVKAAADAKQNQAKFDQAVERELKQREGPIIERAADGAGRDRRARADRMQAARSVAGGIGTAAGGVTAVLGKLGPAGAIAGAAVAALDAAMSKAAKAVDIWGNKTLSQAQRTEMLKEEFVPLYASFKKLAEAVDGTAERVRQAQLKLERALVDIGARAAAGRQYRQADAQFGEPYRALLRAAGAQDQLPPTAAFDRSTAVGERQQADAAQVQQAEDARRRARLAAAGAKEEGFARSVAMKGAVQEQAAAANEAAGFTKVLRQRRANENAGGPRDKAGIAEAAGAAREANEVATVANSTALEQIQRRMENVVKLATAESEARKANIAVMQAELGVLEQKEQRMAGFAKQLGAMNEGDFELAKANLDMLREAEKDGTLRDLPSEVGDAAARIAPEYVAKQREKVGAERAKELGQDYKGIDDSLIQDFTKETLAQVRAQVDKVRADVRVEIDLDAAATAEAIATQIKPVMAEYAAALRLQVTLTKEKAEIEKIQRVNTEG